MYKYQGILSLESGDRLVNPEIAYHTYGKLNPERSNVVWICHALTANSDAADWWHGIVGRGKAFDPEKHFIVCANILGSCYGTTGPLSINPETGKKYYHSFPLITIRDMVQAHILLRKHLGIEKIAVCAGGSMGGYQCLEWAVMEPGVIRKLFLTTTAARESAWGIAIHEAQRLAIQADQTFREERDDAGTTGLKAARAIGMLTYRNYEAFVKTQTDEEANKLENYRAASYIQHQGNKLVERFNAHSYFTLTKSMDSHHLARRRFSDQELKNQKGLERVLKSIPCPAFVVGISTDHLCPNEEQKFLAQHLGNGKYIQIDSSFGHDGFLVEGEKLCSLATDLLTC
ncbi:MAG: homoserine O-acetyltransferase [Bacteroidia bacterium]|nr:homoserine O-acetyltransferase [Bacteroidia bacterium]